MLGFNPRSPRGERLPVSLVSRFAYLFQSTLPTWGATPVQQYEQLGWQVSIHAPHVGSDLITKSTTSKLTKFQSTLPTWGATTRAHSSSFAQPSFNPRSPRGERLRSSTFMLAIVCFNPRSPRGERPLTLLRRKLPLSFNPRSPRGERPDNQVYDQQTDQVSIHAPHVGSDYRTMLVDRKIRFVSIHAPHVGSDT